MNVNKGTRPQKGIMMDNVVEEELCRQAFSLFDKSGSGTISKTVSKSIVYDYQIIYTLWLSFEIFKMII